MANGLVALPFPIVSHASVGANFFAHPVHLALEPVTDVVSTIVPGHFAVAVKVSCLELSLIDAAISKDALAASMAGTVHPGTVVDATILVGHLALDHLTLDISSLKHTAVVKSHDTVSVKVIVLELSLVVVAGTIRETAITSESPVYPVSLAPASIFVVLQEASSVGHTASTAQCSRVYALFSVGINDFLVLDLNRIVRCVEAWSAGDGVALSSGPRSTRGTLRKSGALCRMGNVAIIILRGVDGSSVEGSFGSPRGLRVDTSAFT